LIDVSLSRLADKSYTKFTQSIYRQCNQVERCFNGLKQFYCIANCYEMANQVTTASPNTLVAELTELVTIHQISYVVISAQLLSSIENCRQNLPSRITIRNYGFPY